MLSTNIGNKAFQKKNKPIKPRQRSGATVRFLCRAFFLVKESGVGRPPDRLCRSSNGCALRLAWAVFPRRNRLLLVLRSSSQLLLRWLCSHGFARKVHSHADCALAPSRCSHPGVERSTEGINQYREQSHFLKNTQPAAAHHRLFRAKCLRREIQHS